ncbi:transducer protein htr16 [Halobiforma nitratireducens JCM 10879]|uniref:Transducer protein htr16 n=2 Tax=Halobiforma nitratireducens TaxID=130048 RepID=M0LXZ6_9EURY|nr:transducer protein htr16 [Halobiforma nitratireducens JCM 10879]
MLTNANQEAESLNQWLAAQQSTTRTLSAHQALQTEQQDTVQSALTGELDHLPPEVAHLHYLDYEQETITASTDAGIEGQGVQATNIVWPQAQEFGEVSFDDPDAVIQTWMYSDDGAPSVAFVSPVPETEHALVMVIRTSTRAEQFESPINGTTTTVVGDTTGDILFDENESAFLTEFDSADGEIMDTLDAENEGTLLTSDSVVAFTPVDQAESNWVVVKEAPQSEALLIAQQVRSNLWILLGASFLGLVSLGVMVERGPMRSLRSVSKQATALAAGDLDQEITDENRLDEIGQVRAAFRDIEDYLNVVAAQADALSRQEFDDAVLEESVPGRLGNRLDEMQIDLQEFIADLEQARTEAENSREEAEQSRKEAEQLATSLERQADEFSAHLTKAADGDLTQRLETDVDNDALRRIAISFNDMIEDLESLVVEIQALVKDVDEISSDMTASTEEIKNSSVAVADSIEEISAGAERQSEKLATAAGEMSDLSATVEEIASSSGNVADQSRKAAEMGQQGQQAAERTTEVVDEVETKATEAIEEMRTLQDEVEEISEIVELIDDIASETNLLAMNALIEAANATEDGNGFAVVADEVKALAEETDEATSEVEQLVAGIEKSADALAADMFEMQSNIETSQETIDETVGTFETIVDRVEAANSGIQSINDATDDQAESSQEVAQMVDDVASVSDRTADEAQNVSAAAEEQTSTIQRIATTADTLSDRADELQSQTERFETTADGD